MKKILLSAVVTLGLSSSALMAQTFNMDSYHSEVGFSVKHLMVSTVKGEFKEFKGSFDFDKDKKVFNSMTGVIQVGSVDTSIEKRDAHLKSADFFAADKFPEIKFEMTKYEKVTDSSGLAHGQITMKGVTKDIVLKVEDIATGKGMKGEDILGFEMTGDLLRTEFGLTYNKVLETGGVAVSDKVKLEIQVEAK